jgi:hypothetical protein
LQWIQANIIDVVTTAVLSCHDVVYLEWRRVRAWLRYV